MEVAAMDEACDKIETGGEGKNGVSESVEAKSDAAAAKQASGFVLPLRKRLKSSSTSAATNVYPGSSSGNTSCPSSPTSPPSSPSLSMSVPASPSRLVQAFIQEEKKVEARQPEKETRERNERNDRHDKEPSKQKAEARQSKKRKSKSLFEPSLFTPLPPRQAKVDSYKKAQRKDKASLESTKAKKKRKLKHESSDSEEETLYCVCKQPYDSNQFMIACDTCNDWFHVKCVNLTERKAKTLATYVCPPCKERKQNEKVEELKRRREEEKERDRKREAKRIKKEQEKETEQIARVCANESCKAQAKPNSKYCSTKCGILVAKQRLSNQEKLKATTNEEMPAAQEKQQDVVAASEHTEEEELIGSKTLSVSQAEDLKALKLLEAQKTDTEVNLSLLREKRSKLAEAIKFSTTLIAPTDAAKVKKEKGSNGSTMDIMDCFSCGQPIPGKNFARHMEQCYAKKEGNTYSSAHKNDDQVAADGTTLTYCNYYDSKSASYCTRLADTCPYHSDVKKQKTKRNQLCGCPTTDFDSGYCERLKRECGKHVNWESIRTEELDQELKRLTQLLSSVQEEIGIVKSRIKRRNMLDDSQHRTIEEN